MSLELLCLGASLCLGSPVLKPDLDLGVSQFELLSHLEPLLHAEVGLLLVLGLQLAQLLRGEWCPWLPVSFMFP